MPIVDNIHENKLISTLHMSGDSIDSRKLNECLRVARICNGFDSVQDCLERGYSRTCKDIVTAEDIISLYDGAIKTFEFITGMLTYTVVNIDYKSYDDELKNCEVYMKAPIAEFRSQLAKVFITLYKMSNSDCKLAISLISMVVNFIGARRKVQIDSEEFNYYEFIDIHEETEEQMMQYVYSLFKVLE